jgi:hypothetical protein
MDWVLKYYFNADEREAYQISVHCQNVTKEFNFVTLGTARIAQ